MYIIIFFFFQLVALRRGVALAQGLAGLTLGSALVMSLWALMLILLDWIQMMRGALGAPKWREKQNFRGAKPCMHMDTI